MTAKKSSGVPGNYGIQFEESVIVNRSANDLYQFWRDFRNLPKFMSVLKTVEILENGITRWNVDGPLGLDVAWDAEIINERAGELIAWQSLGDPQVSSAGSVRFIAITDQQTEVKINAQYHPPGEEIGMAIVALFLDDPERRVKEDMVRFKQLMESTDQSI